MLLAMQQPAETRALSGRSLSLEWETAPAPASPSFASLLAALAAPEQKPGAPDDRLLSPGRRPTPTWNDDGLEDDVATLSYERALRAHARYRPTDQSLTQAADSEPNSLEEPTPAAAAAIGQPTTRPTANLESTVNPDAEINRLRAAHFERNLKDASITIRLSRAECAQLHRRAAEAGVTVSAYLRSCTFEAESLRAMVKDTLAQLRSATTQARPAKSATPRRSWLRRLGDRLARLLTPWHESPRAARA
jgi:predicted DNA binding CopG/RHH family protein